MVKATRIYFIRPEYRTRSGHRLPCSMCGSLTRTERKMYDCIHDELDLMEVEFHFEPLCKGCYKYRAQRCESCSKEYIMKGAKFSCYHGQFELCDLDSLGLGSSFSDTEEDINENKV